MRSRQPCDHRRHERDSRPRPPSVERLLVAVRPRAGEREHDALVAAAREVDRRGADAAGGRGAARDARRRSPTRCVARLDALVAGARPARVINATGVIVHTNLGRAPWPEAAIRAAEAAAREPLFLELDRATGRRGPRYRAAEEHLVALTGAEDALVVNNCAAALVLAVGLAGRKGVVVGRGELVEIGGGVRIPEIVRRAGARLVEVGTTNRTRVEDYEAPLREGRAAMVLRVHPSNFTMAGFVEAPDPAELAALAHAHGALVVDDLGSGALLDTAAFGLAHEPTPTRATGRRRRSRDVLRRQARRRPAGRADRRAGGPRRASPEGPAGPGDAPRQGDPRRRRRDARPLPGRPGDGRDPRLADDRDPAGALRDARGGAGGAGRRGVRRARSWPPSAAGRCPGRRCRRSGWRSPPGSADRLLAALRAGEPAVVGRIEDGRVVLDLRTVEPASDDALAAAVGVPRRRPYAGGRT